MARIDHTNCTHPRTPAGRTACRKSGAVAPVTKPVSIHAKTADELTTERVTAYARKHHTDPDSIIAAMAELKPPRLTAAQLASPIFQSMLRR